MRKSAIALFAVIVVGAMVVAAAVTVGQLLEGDRCERTALRLGVEHKFNVVTGCLVKISGQWVGVQNTRG